MKSQKSSSGRKKSSSRKKTSGKKRSKNPPLDKTSDVRGFMVEGPVVRRTVKSGALRGATSFVDNWRVQR